MDGEPSQFGVSAEQMKESRRKLLGKLEGATFTASRIITKFLGHIFKIVISIARDVISGLLKIFSSK
ncbi:hypothetical protein A3D00_05355 [Candidatus Woesebacteria bacterium RIFCSPHIGHO2_02_FULL_38_9]|uniref:Uncharacterized protein n=1 Tax=Candidatus Woesebacteria bacterium RIFCSPHIGHO2_01_FULL_39_28 TaxID=1802496 RepID=A0A1F7YC62_9BACT|nr:MAG: hypothetical protein A2627_03125 [Candidatus Woesebacteria bacterium RIFCSPHIGHO2_01_FULL_39_28]OGM35043.1 MAG: hypothetical protein A3D00_05355 [Candidatus Woesebacteria bacterium RIFCSPHIGHO2_02_FULL_38_9]OGM58038.1 MAG: hypothetical protein A3A50_02135 [Candidatus Woesebacteria bacterium RIFCSPLOWO2_01_FULL_38_20]